MMPPKVSVIIPVYKAEKYIERCAKSLFEQTIDFIEYVFIDDFSPDRSVEKLENIIEEYPDRKNQVLIISNERNYGVSHSRQIGLEKATGEYIIHCDPDDWVEPNMYKIMYEEALRTNVDMVCCDYYLENNNKTEISHQDLHLYKEDAVHAMLTGKIHGALWNKLIKHDFIVKHKQSFHNGIEVMEDFLFLVPLYMKTDKIVFITQPLYHYRNVQSSITHTLNIHIIDSYLKVLNVINKEYGNNETIRDGYLKAFANRSQLLINNIYCYNPERWRIESEGISLKYFHTIKGKVLAWLIKHKFDNLTFFLIRIKTFLTNIKILS